MTARALGRQYANALFDAARKNGQLGRVRQDVASFTELLDAHDELRRVLGNPAVRPTEKAALVEALIVALGGSSDEWKRLLLLLAERDRLGSLNDVIAAFNERTMAVDGIVRAEITTANALDDASKLALSGALSRALDREVRMTERVDPAIIGGIVAKVGSVVFDGSVTRQIERLRERLLAGA